MRNSAGLEIFFFVFLCGVIIIEPKISLLAFNPPTSASNILFPSLPSQVAILIEFHDVILFKLAFQPKEVILVGGWLVGDNFVASN